MKAFFSFLSLWSFLVSLFFAATVYYRSRKERLNIVFALLCLSVAYWSFTQFEYREAVDEQTAYFWARISSLWPLTVALFLHFALIYTDGRRRRPLALALIYLPALILSSLALATDWLTKSAIEKPWGWTYGHPTPFGSAIYLLAIIVAIFTFVILLRYYFRLGDPLLKRKTRLIMLALALPVVVGGTTDGLLPILGVRVPELLTSTFALPALGAISYAMWKYQAFAISPGTAAADIISTMSDVLLLVDIQGDIVMANEAAEGALGYGRGGLDGQALESVFTEEGWRRTAFARTVHEGLFDADFADFETTLQGKRGVVEVSLSNSVVEQHLSLQGTVCIARDITERKRAQKELEKTLKEYRRLYEDMPIAYVHTAPDGRVTEVNQAALDMFGFADRSALGLVKAQDLYADPAERDRLLAQLAVRGRVEGWELRFRRPDGTVFWALDSVRLLRDEEGKPLRLESYLSDITPQKRLSQELARSNEELQQFAHVASHDLQEPLRMVASYVQLLQKRYQGQLDDNADEFIAFAAEGANRMQAMINDLLLYSRVGSRGEPFAPTDANQALSRALDNLQIMIKENEAIVASDSLPTIPADASQLVQLFQNLIGNAIRFRREETPRILVSAAAGDREWIFSVRDNGIGIESQYLEKIFVIFQRLHGKHRYSGTGIGLAVCKRIVERHGGRIWAESEPGKGSTFFFALPTR